MSDESATFRVGKRTGSVLRAIVLGILLATAIVSAVGHDSLHKVFRYEGF